MVFHFRLDDKIVELLVIVVFQYSEGVHEIRTHRNWRFERTQPQQ